MAFSQFAELLKLNLSGVPASMADPGRSLMHDYPQGGRPVCSSHARLRPLSGAGPRGR
jgi:hypothetical protein